MKALVLSAGLGTRLRPLTDYIPKPLVPITGKPLISVITDSLLESGIDEFVFNPHHLSEQIEEYIKNDNILSDISLIMFEPSILGTGESIARVSDIVSEEEFFLVYNGDIVSDINILSLIDYHKSFGSDVTLALTGSGSSKNVRLDNGNVTDIRFELNTDGSKGELFTFSGIAVYNCSFAKKMPRGRFYSVIDYIIEKMKTENFRVGGFNAGKTYWNDIGDPKSYIGLHRDILTHKKFAPSGVLIPKDGIIVSEKSYLAANVLIDGFVFVGNGVQIAEKVYLKDCIVFDNTVIEAGAHFENCVIAPGFVMNNV